MTEESHRRITTRLKIVGMAGALLGGGVALWQYHDSSKKQFQAPVWQKQVDLYTAATETIARLAYTNDEREWNDAYLRFWELYAGSLILVEDDDVASGMIEFGKKLQAIGDDFHKRDDSLESAAIDLSYRFRRSINRSVGSGLPALKNTKAE